MCLCLCFHYSIFKSIFKILCICRYCFALSYGFQVFFSQYFCRYHAEKIVTKGKCMFVCLKFMLLKNFFAANKFWWEKSLANTKLLYLRNFKRTSKESYEQYWTFLDKFLRNSGQNIEVICSLLKILLYLFSIVHFHLKYNSRTNKYPEIHLILMCTYLLFQEKLGVTASQFCEECCDHELLALVACVGGCLLPV